MKLRADRPYGPILAGLGLLLATGLGVAAAHAGSPPSTSPGAGPAADYPMVLGASFTIDGVTYTPSDKMNLDQVGYAEIDAAAGAGISIAHRTLPLPSYAEVTSLRTGRTILVRVERRGPPSGGAIVALSPAAAAQLGTQEARTPIRIRRVNPPEPERAALRAHQPAPPRMDTPMSLVTVLLRKLDPALVASAPAATPAPSPGPSAPASPVAASPVIEPKHPAVMPAERKPLAPAPVAAKPAALLNSSPPTSAGKPAPAAKPATKPSAKGAAVVQIGAYASRTSAEKTASRVGGTVTPAGKLFRVRITGLQSPQAAAAALAKARAAGYSEARILHAD